MSNRQATIDDYRWLYSNTDYMADNERERWAYWENVILDACVGKMVFEYGSGRAYSLRKELIDRGSVVYSWDPSINNNEIEITRADVCCSFDVLEHVEHQEIVNVIKTIQRIAPRQIHAIATMSDVHDVNGEKVEMHHIQEPFPWWIRLVEEITGKTPTVHSWRHKCRFLLEW